MLLLHWPSFVYCINWLISIYPQCFFVLNKRQFLNIIVLASLYQQQHIFVFCLIGALNLSFRGILSTSKSWLPIRIDNAKFQRLFLSHAFVFHVQHVLFTCMVILTVKQNIQHRYFNYLSRVFLEFSLAYSNTN